MHAGEPVRAQMVIAHRSELFRSPVNDPRGQCATRWFLGCHCEGQDSKAVLEFDDSPCGVDQDLFERLRVIGDDLILWIS